MYAARTGISEVRPDGAMGGTKPNVWLETAGGSGGCDVAAETQLMARTHSIVDSSESHCMAASEKSGNIRVP